MKRAGWWLFPLFLVLGLPVGAQDQVPTKLHDPQLELDSKLDESSPTILEGAPQYQVQPLLQAVQSLEARSDDAGPLDGYLLALGYLHLAAIHRFYDRHDEEHLPSAFEELDEEQLVEQGLEHAKAWQAQHPDHSDILRIQAELTSFQIDGMISGMTKGPEAKELLDKALNADPANARAHYVHARMLFHNPSFAGGDKDAALKLFRRLAPVLNGFRVSLYVARCYQEKEMLPQARYWVKKALSQAPGNPEALWLQGRLREEAEE